MSHIRPSDFLPGTIVKVLRYAGEQQGPQSPIGREGTVMPAQGSAYVQVKVYGLGQWPCRASELQVVR